MNKILLLLVSTLLIVSCKTKQGVNELAANKTLVATSIIKGHYANKKDFSTLSIRANVKYKDGKQSHSVTADIRIKKDEIIWINVKLLGFPVAKVLITPTQVSYYERINNNYFEGDFSLLSKWLGTDLDFDKVQNLLIGNAIDNLNKSKYLGSIENDLYRLEDLSKSNTDKSFYFEASNFLLKKEKISQEIENRNLEIDYLSHSKTNDIFLPNQINIKAQQKESVFISIDYKSVFFNENLNFSFSIPDGYDQITID